MNPFSVGVGQIPHSHTTLAVSNGILSDPCFLSTCLAFAKEETTLTLEHLWKYIEVSFYKSIHVINECIH